MSSASNHKDSITCSVFIATSLDGFIARENGDLDWLPGIDGSGGGEDYGYGKFIASVDTIVMGRTTYEKALTFGEWPYRNMKVVVLSSGFPKTFKKLAEGIQGISLPPIDLVRELASAGSKHIYVDGGKTIQGFLRARMIHEITITRVPVLIGRGIPLFGTLTKDIRLQHISTRSFPNGLVQSNYRLDNPG